MRSYKKLYFATTLVLLADFQINAQEKEFDESVLSEKGKQAFKTLLKTELFALGPIYSSASVPEGELALDILTEEKKATSALKNLVDKATPEGGLYSLFGLRKLKSEAFDK